jgi:hypothetical protein
MKRVVAAILVLCVGGCGLTMTHGPDPRQPADQRPSCTETFDAPKRDAYGAVVGLVAILFGVVAIKAADNESVGVPLVVGGAVVTIGAYVSGGVGYYRVKRCKKAIETFDHRASNDHTME